MSDNKSVKVRQVRGSSNAKPRVQDTLKALGLGRVGKERVCQLNPAVIGMLRKVTHLIQVTEN
jgi:large subunit ribosomal protein L30